MNDEKRPWDDHFMTCRRRKSQGGGAAKKNEEKDSETSIFVYKICT